MIMLFASSVYHRPHYAISDEAKHQRLKPKYLLNAVVISLFLFFIIPQFTTFKGALASLANVNPLWLLPIAAICSLSYVSAALALVSLAPIKLAKRQAILVQVASAFASKVLPNGFGSAVLLIRYLEKAGLKDINAAALLVVQRLIDFTMFVIPLGAIVLLNGGTINQRLTFSDSFYVAVTTGLIIVIGITLIWRNKVFQAIENTRTSLKNFTLSPAKLALTALCSFGVSAAYIGSLYIALQAVGLPISLAATALVYATAAVAGSISPTPGGLGALEIAMVATLIGLGMPQPEAYAGVILYRLVTFWLPVPVGFAAYHYLQRRQTI